MIEKKYADKYDYAGFQVAGRALERQEQLAIFGDRLELWNEADLPFGLEPEAIKQEHASRPRNLLIAELFFRLGGGIREAGRSSRVPLTRMCPQYCCLLRYIGNPDLPTHQQR